MTADPDLVLSVLGGGVALAFILAAFWVRFRDPEAAIERMRQADREKHEREEYEANPGSFLDEEPAWEEPGFERDPFIPLTSTSNAMTRIDYVAPAPPKTVRPPLRGSAVGVRQRPLGQADPLFAAAFPADDPHHDALWEAGGLAETAISFLDRGRWPEARALMAQIVEMCDGEKP